MAYGVANLGGAPAPSEADAILEAAQELGLRWVDTAPAYGESEARLGAFVARRSVRFSVATKLGPLSPDLGTGELGAYVRTQLARSLHALGRSSVEALLLHRSEDLRAHGRALMDALERERHAGRVGRLGLSVYDPAELELLELYPELDALQLPFNLFDRRFAEPDTQARWRRPGRLVFARSALLQGLIVLEPRALPKPLAHAAPWLERLRKTLAERSLDPVLTALDFALAESHADYVVVGAESAAQLRGWMAPRPPLPRETRAALAAALAEVPAEVFDPRRWGCS